MRKLFIIITLIVVSLVARAQVYDGITQPTKFRIFMPVTTSLHGNGSTVAPFVGYRADVAKWLSVTQVLQYNMTSEAVSFGAWLNVNYFIFWHVQRTIRKKRCSPKHCPVL